MPSSKSVDDLRALPTRTLVELAVKSQRAGGIDVEHEDLGPLVALHERANLEVFTAATAMSASSDPHERAVCARILRELGQGERPFSRDALLVLAPMAEVETDPYVLHWIISALTWQYEPGALELVLPFAHHPDARVRFMVASNPFAMVPDPETPDPRLIDTLIALSDDSDADVRWYATVALADEYPGDGPTLREALANRLSDPDDQVSSVAKAGLARRHDPRGGG